MSAFKGTPGPWGVWHGGVYAGPFKRVEGGIKGYRAQICEMDDLDLDSDEVDANARLIAAAPDLLEALRKVDEQLGDVECESSADARAVERCQQTIRAAIAKATGGDA